MTESDTRLYSLIYAGSMWAVERPQEEAPPSQSRYHRDINSIACSYVGQSLARISPLDGLRALIVRQPVSQETASWSDCQRRLSNKPVRSHNGALSERRGRAGSRMDWNDEELWLRSCIIRLRTLLRFALHPEVEAGLKALIGDAEERLDELQREQVDPFEDAPGG